MTKIEQHHLGLFGIDLKLLYKRKEFHPKYAAEVLNCSIEELGVYEKNGLKYYEFCGSHIYKRDWIIEFIYNYRGNEKNK